MALSTVVKIISDAIDRIKLGELNDIEAAEKLVSVNGLEVIEAGCAGGAAARGLAKRGAKVLGVEPDPVQAALNRDHPTTAGVTLLEASAQALPADNESFDGVFMFRSLHHVPETMMDKALTEASRVLRPDGFLYVAEPAMNGSFFDLMLPFHDESEVRILAQQALDRTAGNLFTETAKYSCFQQPKFDKFAALIDVFVGMSFNRITRDMIDRPQVRENFDAAQTESGYVFIQPMLINLYRGVRR